LPDELTDSQRFDMLQGGLDLIEQGITVFDAGLRLVAWNQPFLKLLEFPTELAFVGAPFESFIRYNARRGEYGQGDPDRQVAERVDAAKTFVAHITERQRPNGRTLLVRGEPLPHKGFVTLYSDVTEQRYIENLIQNQNIRLEEQVRRRTAQLENANANLTRANNENLRIAAALRRSEERLRLINDTIPTMIGYFTWDETYQYVNRGYAEWFGVPQDSINGRRIRDVVGDRVYEQVGGYIRTALDGRQVTYEYTKQQDDRILHARSTLVPEIDGDGQTIGCFVFSYDITEQKQMQAALIHAQKMEAIGQLTGGLAHDFNNLLTVIIGNLAALQDHRSTDAEINEFIDPALQSARRGAQLIKRLLAFSRQQPLEPEAVDIGRLVDGMIALVRRSLPESIAISIDLPAEPIYLLVDPGQMESALLNFALNARDAMPDGGSLRLSVSHRRFDEDARDYEVPAGAYVAIEMADTGMGMDAATLARVFEPFFTTKRFGLGSGLGLSMAYGFAKQSGGGIRICSDPGQGTRVSMVLPHVVPEAERVLPTDTAEGSNHSGLVLLVEDEPEVRKVVRQQLVSLGYLVLEANDGNQAKELIEHVDDIVLVLTDVVMPGTTSGRQLARFVAGRRPKVPVLLMSGYADDLADNEADNPPLLAKPFTRDELARALATAVRDAS
jgi:PAS domain S-box-containing protein